MKEITLKAYAKINLSLDVLGRRANGYHDVKMIMQTIGICDTLTFAVIEEDEIILTTNKEALPNDQGNLVYRAIALLKEEKGIKQGMKVTLSKEIPMAAGMAGGSADCAAALVAANELYDLKLSKEELMEYGVKLGADVPYCIMQGTALSEGIGEILTPLNPMPDCYILVAKPPIDVSTKYVYEHLDAQESYEHPDVDGMVEAINRGDLKGVTDRMGNVLQNVTVPAYPVIDEIKDHMMKDGALNAMMSGSGPTVFGIFDDEETAKAAYESMKNAGYSKEVFLVKPYQV